MLLFEVRQINFTDPQRRGPIASEADYLNPSRRGLCYWLCEFVETHRLSPWQQGKSFQDVIDDRPMLVMQIAVTYAKARAVRHSLGQIRQQTFDNTFRTFQPGTITHVTCSIRHQGHAFGHTISVLTDGARLLVFDPNFGFYLVVINDFWAVEDELNRSYRVKAAMIQIEGAKSPKRVRLG